MSSIDETKAAGNGHGAAHSGPEYWRSLDDLADTPEFREFLEKEFPGGVEVFSSTSRRHFMKVMGASLAMAGLAGCRWPKETIVPFANRPDGRTPGVAQHFATTGELGGVGNGLVVTSYDGRPVKVEGNPDHPQSRGATTAIEQNLILEMYDPDRALRVENRAGDKVEASSWKAFVDTAKAWMDAARANGGEGLRFLAEASSSETLALARKALQKTFPAARWHEYEPLSRDNEREGARVAFGRPRRAQLRLDKAERIAAFDTDLLGDHPAALRHARDFAAGRRVDAAHPKQTRLNRLWVCEPTYTVTGGMADERLVAAAGDVAAVIARLALAVAAKAGLASIPAALEGALKKTAAQAADSKWIDELAADLVAHRGRSLVAVGARQPAAAHALVHWLNEILGNVGKTVDYTVDSSGDRPTHVAAIRQLCADMDAGMVETLVVLGGNPVFDAPADLDFGGKLAKVKNTAHLSLYANETSERCAWVLPRAHTFEAWGDARAWDGTWSLTQPLIAPLWQGKTPAELVALLGGRAVSAHELTREAFRAVHGATGAEKAWRCALHDGVVKGVEWARQKPVCKVSAIAGALETGALETGATAPKGGFEVVFTGDPKLHDGRFANSGWLQELPEPITKLTWDNAALIAPATAAELGVARSGVKIGIEIGGRKAVVPAFIQPGQAASTVVVWLGQGRRTGGRVLPGVGVDTYPLRGSDAMDVATGAKVTKVGGLHVLATTQDHHAMDSDVGRDETQRRAGILVQEGTVKYYQDHPDFAAHYAHVPKADLWEREKYEDGHRWGMAIDLNVCTGCSACVVACQAENNIPVVGKDEVTRGREMHWLRIDRYYKGEPEAPESMAAQPVPCMQCENAPCEQVCPVAATVHSSEGLNDMVYNRCIGTRYCSNNCPFKVRRFNWFLNHKDQNAVEQMRHNPEVSIRSRGVMEKCTYCVQRINAVKIKAKNERRPVADGEVTTACAQVCPTNAIAFGDLNDKKSRAAELQAEQRCYGLLDDYKVLPRTKYLARLKNPLHDPGHHPHGGGHGGEKKHGAEHGEKKHSDH